MRRFGGIEKKRPYTLAAAIHEQSIRPAGHACLRCGFYDQGRAGLSPSLSPLPVGENRRRSNYTHPDVAQTTPSRHNYHQTHNTPECCSQGIHGGESLERPGFQRLQPDSRQEPKRRVHRRGQKQARPQLNQLGTKTGRCAFVSNDGGRCAFYAVRWSC